MKKILFGLMLLGLPIISSAQSQHAIDSLLAVLKTAKEDTNKVKTLNALSNRIMKSDPEKGYQYARQSLDLAQKIGPKFYVIAGYRNIAGYYFFTGNFKLATEYSLKTIPLIEQINNKHALFQAYDNLAVLSERQNDHVAAVDYSDKALQIAQSINDSVGIATVTGNRGITYINLGDYTNALNCYFSALKINEARNDKSRMANNYFNIGYIYRIGKINSEKAIYYYQLSLKLSKEINDQVQLASCLFQLGETYMDKSDWNNAADYLEQALAINNQIGDIPGISFCNRSLGMTYFEQGKYNDAIRLVNEALKLSQQAEDNTGISTAYETLGEIYTQKKDYANAINYLVKGLAIAKKSEIKANISSCLNELAVCYKAQGNYKLSMDNWEQYALLKDSMLNDETIKKTSEMEARYNLEKKDKEIVLLTKDKQIQQLEIKKQTFWKNSLIAGLALACILFFFAYRYYHVKQLLKLQTLRAKIASDLHDDIGSTLSSISIFSLIARQESKEVIPLLEQIGEYSRKMLDSMADIVWTINPENDNFEKIILRMRSFAFELLGARNIDFKFNVDETVSTLKLPMETRKNLFLIFKEATNNLAKYAQADSAIFSIKSSKNSLTMLIRDNGKGFDLQKHTEGNGLRNMKARAIEIGAKFLIESEPDKGTTIQVLMKTA